MAIAITLDLPTVKPKDSLRMGDEHLDTISETESNELIKSSVENLVPSPSESKDISDGECDLPLCDDSPRSNHVTSSNPLFDSNEDFTSSDNELFSEEDIPMENFRIFSNPLFDLDEEIISTKENLICNEVLESINSIPPGIDHFDAESGLLESLLNRDILIDSSPKIDSLLDEFDGELILLKSIPSGIDEAGCDPEEEIRLIEKFDSLVEEIDLSLTPDDSMPSGIENDAYDSEGDILFLEELLSNDSLSLPKNESFHFNFPTSPHPSAKPPDDVYFDDEPITGILIIKVEKSHHLLSYQGFKAFQLPFESPMMIYEGNIPILDVPFLHFYPP
nr:hypothetical protein [Tanacetum cinerariifolium]